jgi:DNA topoisomerase-1
VFDPEETVQTIADPKDAADCAGLRYVSDDDPGIRRRRAGKGFCYLRPDGSRLADPRSLARIRSLVIPPAWTDVWICPFADGHIQAIGRDARRRKQYRYHTRFRELRESSKYEHVVAFAEALPTIRARVLEDMGRRGLPREKVLATVVHLLEATLIRVGNDDHARQNKSYGLTTLKNRHVEIDGSEIRFQFAGKGGKQWSLTVKNRRVAKVIKACQELPGQRLLQYLDEDGERRDVTSGDVNAYLKYITGLDITAKDFRTWAGTVLAALALHEVRVFNSTAEAKRNLRAAISQTAVRLGNTATICRKCYIHPDIFDLYLDRELVLDFKSQAEVRNGPAGLISEEVAVLALLRNRSKQNLNGGYSHGTNGHMPRRPRTRRASRVVGGNHPVLNVIKRR